MGEGTAMSRDPSHLKLAMSQIGSFPPLRLQRYARYVLIILLMMVNEGCTSTELQWLRDNSPVFASPLKVSKGRMVNIVKTERECGWGIASHPFLIRFPDNRIVVTHYAVGDTDHPKGHSEINWPHYSDDFGKTWVHGDPYARRGEPQDFRGILFKGDVLPKPGLINLTRAGQVVLASNRMAVFEYISTTSNTVGRWTDLEGRWRELEPVTIRMPANNYTKKNVLILEYAVADTNGYIYLVAYHHAPQNTRMGLHTVLLISRDGGAHFDYQSTVAKPDDIPDSIEGPCEPAIALLPDGEMIVVMRTGGHVPRKMLMARSRDYGQTWKLSDMEMTGVQPKLIRMSNGVLVLATGRPGNVLYFSTDGGITWPRKEVVWEGGNTSGYIDIMEVSPGRLLAVFDISNTPDPTLRFSDAIRVCGVYAMFIDVDYTPEQ